MLDVHYKKQCKTWALYVCQCLKQENVGLVDEETVYQIIYHGVDDTNHTLDYRDTVGFIKAYHHLHRLASLEIGLLDNNLICEVHKILINHRSHLCTVGQYSGKERITEFQGTIHYYVTCNDIEQTMQVLIDEFNRRLDAIERESRTDKVKPLESLIHLTSWFVCKFLQVHPFGDGNGRMARLLYTYIMEAYGFLFPTPLFWYSKEELHSKDSNQEYKSWCELLSNIRLTLDFKNLELNMLHALGEGCKEYTTVQ